MAMMGSGKADGDDRARLSAEAAVSSPLLEDVNLSGCQGYLSEYHRGHGIFLSVNLMRLVASSRTSASDNATVVVGTVIDPDMSGEMRVTIVATGLGNSAKQDAGSRVKLVKNEPGNVDYRDFDAPTIIRKQTPDADQGTMETDPDYLDIQAFLRRQAD